MMKSRGLKFFCISYLAFLIFSAIGVVLINPQSLFETNMSNVLNDNFIFGTDSLGRSLLFRCLYGVYISLITGLAGVLLAFIIALFFGALAGYFGSWLDRAISRVMEILISLPSLVVMALLYLVIESSLGLRDQPVFLLILVLGLSSWMSMARFIRNLILKEKNEQYIESAKALGASDLRIFLRHILPNIFSSLIIFVSLQIPQALMAEGLLSFLGFGIQAPQISLGSLLQDGWKTMSTFPHLLIGPGVILFLTVFSIYYLLDEFRYSMDPRLKWEKFN